MNDYLNGIDRIRHDILHQFVYTCDNTNLKIYIIIIMIEHSGVITKIDKIIIIEYRYCNTLYGIYKFT